MTEEIWSKKFITPEHGCWVKKERVIYRGLLLHQVHRRTCVALLSFRHSRKWRMCATKYHTGDVNQLK